jgi:CheY-like chemotaxis protein
MALLLVEDDHIVREVITTVLTQCGLEVSAVASGEEAIDLLEKGFVFRLLLTDIVLPGGYDGWTMAIAARRYLKEVPVVYITASHQQRSPVTGSVFLRKPVRPKLLLDVVGTLLGENLGAKAGIVQAHVERIGKPNYMH